MANLFGLFNSAASSLMAQQISLEITGQNIANAYTDGYSRQRVDLETAVSIRYSEGFIGTGVNVGKIKRIHDKLVEAQHNDALQERGKWESSSQFLQTIERVFNETNDGELSTIIGDFFNEWYNLANNPADYSMRTNLMTSANLLTDRISQVYFKLEDIRSSIEDELSGIATDVNNITRDIAKINSQIKSVEREGQENNNLRDKRDKLIADLSNIIDLKAIHQKDGTVTILTAGAYLLVSGADSSVVNSQIDRSDPDNPISKILLGNIDILPEISEGKAGGLKEIKNEVLPDLFSQLDNLAASLISEVNSIHSQGYGTNESTGIAFFQSFTSTISGSNQGAAKSFRLSDEIMRDPRNIAAGQIPAPGDNANALIIADLQNKMVGFTVERSQTFLGYYSETVTSLGSVSQRARNGLEHSDIIEKQLDTFKQSISGVSLDEELSNMILFQRAYQSSARFINTVDSMMDTLINRMGT